MPMHVAFRTDSSTSLGTGHLFRCITLANALRGRGASISFFCCELPGNLISSVEEMDFPVHRLPFGSASPSSGARNIRHAHWSGISWENDLADTLGILPGNRKFDWMVVDHYALDARWEAKIRPHADKIMVIDDLVDRPHDCDLLLDQNFHENPDPRYVGLVPEHCRRILGPRYALLRPEFTDARKTLRDRDGIVRRILVFFGGSDVTNGTGKALEALRRLGRPDIAVDVVVGAANPHRDEIRELCTGMGNTKYHFRVRNMAELMAKADLALGAPGTATWERCFLGLPAITLVLAENQFHIAARVSRTGSIVDLGWNSAVDADLIAAAVHRLADDPGQLKRMSSQGIELMGGESFEGTDGVVREMTGDRHALA